MSFVGAFTSSDATHLAQTEIEKLCDLLLEVAGRDATRLQSVARHARVLDAAMPFMTPVQAMVARARVKAAESKWGKLLPGNQSLPENDGVAPILRVANWLSTRRDPERLLTIMHLAAVAVLEGETSMRRIYDLAHRTQIDGKYLPRGIDSFREWLTQLRVAMRETEGVYTPGTLCDWWAKDMAPSRDRRSPYAECLRLRERMLNDRISTRYR